MSKNIIVTGGAQGIGKIVTQHLLKEGFNVSVFEIDAEAISEFREEETSEKLAIFLCDISLENEVTEAIKRSVATFGRIDGLVNNAAIANNKSITELSVEEWNRVIAVNLTGPFLCAKHAAPHLKATSGSIINLCSTRAFQSEPNTEAYSTSKGGVFALTHALAMSLGPEIRVNCISPGWIDVSGIRKKSEANPYHITEADKNQHPVGRVGNGADIARMVLFLLNPENSFITGQNFVVDGGMTKKMIYI
ncbi:SDR family oxidoreductase [Mariniphaga sp.]|uniref:SDR family oxidoreductase n=1 Tax=Mariniphaga sp. TaxID=1954475 RepID=UPI003563E0D5